MTDQPTAISKNPPINVNRNTSTTRLMAKSLVGTDLLHFHIEEFVGGGGMGAVFRATDMTLRRTVAVKVLSQDHVDDEMIRRFRHEAESAARLDHAAMPHVYYVGEDDGWYFIAFEFIEGKNIRDYVADQGPLSIPQAITYLADIADAVQHASSRDVRAPRYQTVQCIGHQRRSSSSGGHGARPYRTTSIDGQRPHGHRRDAGHVRLHLTGTSKRSSQRRYS